MSESKTPFLDMFEDPDHIAGYADGPAKFMPGYQDVQRMAIALIRERAPETARVLVHGAGGGLELEAFATANPEWRFLGVDPAKLMVEAARHRLGDMAARADFHVGYIEDAPRGPFDAATSLLTLHFLDVDARRNAVAEIVSRLTPGAPVIVAHSSFPQGERERDLWLSRYEAFGIATGVDPAMAGTARQAVAAGMPILDPETDAAILRQGGLRDVTPFYHAFTWRGWVGTAPE